MSSLPNVGSARLCGRELFAEGRALGLLPRQTIAGGDRIRNLYRVER